MKVLLHAGIDKAGSTAIQAHLHTNREWLLERGVYLPQTGLTRYGHRQLFLPALEPAPWSDLAAELTVAQGEGYSHSILSYEGAASLQTSQIEQLADYLDGFDLTFLFYLRDQAEVLQSGYLQNLKAGPQTLSVDQLREDYRRLPLNGRDYARMLARFRAAVGITRIRLRPFVSERLTRGDVVDDLLATLDVTADDGFERLQMRQNPSLDVPCARLLNARDAKGTPQGREALVDDLLWIIRRDGPQQKWFLSREAVTLVREHYRPSNERLLREFNLNETVEDFFGRDSIAWCEGEPVDTEHLEAALESLQRWPRWNGKICSGEALAPLLAESDWQFDTARGDWTCGQRAVIHFRVPLSRYAQRPRDLLLRIHGSYPETGGHSEVIVNGKSLGAQALNGAELNVAASELGRERELLLELCHAEPEGRATARFRLQSLELVRT